MRAIALASVLLASATCTSAQCSSYLERKEWRALTTTERQNYINAVLCLKKLGSKLGKSVKSQSRFDDFAYVHYRALNIAHSSAHFLPWHRAYLHVYEQTLRAECKYTGALPYWDWTIDSQAPEKSPIWSSSAFGGDGSTSSTDRCVKTGPFASFKSQFGRPFCLSRTFSGNLGSTSSFYTPEAIYFMLSELTTYDDFRRAVEEGPHNNVHGGIGGCMALIDMSANDPVFMLHHANIDRMWYIWQNMHLDVWADYGGPNADDSEATQDDRINLFGIGPTDRNWTVAQVLDTLASTPLCYTYLNTVRNGINDEGKRNQRRGIDDGLNLDTSNSTVELLAAADPYEVTSTGTAGSTPHHTDRHNKKKLRCPRPVSDHLAAQMRYDQETYDRMRRREREMCRFIHFVNSRFPKYRSRAALESVEAQVFVPISVDEEDKYRAAFRKMVAEYRSAKAV
ncbi:hypothetical protein HK105_207725 [Polyrhizophydium stewartii]|uniref:Tyrosinase copper-binding domain-containing protein n=1 Tax=Polyrhizophydium stewartii TaxID=2732419 RepID=A0ABR4MZM3_9FUNG